MLSGSSGEVQTGTSYIRWGRKTCESSASLVYAGNRSRLLYMYKTQTVGFLGWSLAYDVIHG